jgi:hypothetical protein
MSDWAPSIAALLALIYFLLFPAQFASPYVRGLPH